MPDSSKAGGKPAALLISPEAPYPLDGGGALRTASILHFLAGHFELDLIAFRHPKQKLVEAIPDGLLRQAHTVNLIPHRADSLSRAWRNSTRLLRRVPPLVDRFSGYDEQIAHLLSGKSYDVAVLEHFWSASYLYLARRHARQVVLDLHNIESVWHESCARVSGFPRKTIHRAFARAALFRERTWLRECHLALTASTEDEFRVRRISPETPVCVYPNAIPARPLPPDPAEITEPPTIAFSGNLEYEPNRIGLRWFLRNVWPLISRDFPGVTFRIIGKNDSAIRPDIATLPGVEATGPVDDTFRYMSRATICIAPLLSGSGTRLKIIEAWAAAKPVVSTTIGAEGLGAVDGESILLADSAREFEAAIRTLILDPALRKRLSCAGRACFHNKFTWEAAWETLKTSMLHAKIPGDQ